MTRPARLGVLTIGQAPRVDLTGELSDRLPPGTRLVERGALDELDTRQIHALQPARDETTLTTRLRDGTSVRVDRDGLIPLLQHGIHRLEDQGVDATLLVCTGTFPPLTHTRPLLDADRLIVHGTTALLGRAGRLGVIAPLPQQQQPLRRRWQADAGIQALLDHADPYGPHAAERTAQAARRLARAGATLVVLDCMGYTAGHQRQAHRLAGIPVIPARALVGALAGQLLAALAAQ